MVARITSFWGPYKFLSNFYPRPLLYNAQIYPTAEHAFQCQKVLSQYQHDRVREQSSPGLAKKLARQLPRRGDWEEVKVDIMKNILRAKFAREFNFQLNPLHKWLLETGDCELVEGNDWGDTFWGQCPLGVGENMLGKLLMKVRQEIREAQ